MAPLTSEQAGDDLRVDHRLARRDPSDGVGEVGQPGHPLLEQVADPGGVLPQEIDRVAGLDILGKHQDRDRRVLRPDPAGRLEPFGRVGRRHPHVDHDDIGTFALDEREKAGHVHGLADDLEPRGREGGRQRLAEQHRVVGEDDADRRFR